MVTRPLAESAPRCTENAWPTGSARDTVIFAKFPDICVACKSPPATSRTIRIGRVPLPRFYRQLTDRLLHPDNAPASLRKLFRGHTRRGPPAQSQMRASPSAATPGAVGVVRASTGAAHAGLPPRCHVFRRGRSTTRTLPSTVSARATTGVKVTTMMARNFIQRRLSCFAISCHSYRRTDYSRGKESSGASGPWLCLRYLSWRR